MLNGLGHMRATRCSPRRNGGHGLLLIVPAMQELRGPLRLARLRPTRDRVHIGHRPGHQKMERDAQRPSLAGEQKSKRFYSGVFGEGLLILQLPDVCSDERNDGFDVVVMTAATSPLSHATPSPYHGCPLERNQPRTGLTRRVDVARD